MTTFPSTALYRRLLSFLLATTCAVHAAIIQGTVRNENTRAYLEGAEVVVMTANASATTDRDGSFTLRDIPAGPHRLRVSYAGLDPREMEVIAREAGTHAPVNIRLTSPIYTLDAFVVTTDRE